ncbi:MAG: SGNH/GDSL hydrolase family protein [Ignavibacteriales bacterium]|nr:SGNH/GDSL hydrolase family protein [Ignavibacteriales bacterium]
MRDREISVEKPAGTYRILVLGDSTTLGWGVPFDRLFTKLLELIVERESALATVSEVHEVLNGGVGNYNTAQEAAWFKAHGVRLNPDMVVVAWFINDAEPTPRLSRNWLASHSFAYVRHRVDRRRVVAPHRGAPDLQGLLPEPLRREPDWLAQVPGGLCRAARPVQNAGDVDADSPDSRIAHAGRPL